MDRSKVLNWSYSWAMHDFRKSILLAFVAAIFFAAAIASRAQTQPGGSATVANAQSSKGSPTPAVAPQVRPAFPQGLLPAPQEQDAASREKAEADKARREAQVQEEQRLAQETQARGYWVDPATKLMWTAKDNGGDVTWRQATKYCRDLRLAGYPNWRLATIDELQGIYDGSGFAAPPPRKGIVWALAGRPKGGLFLTGNHHWSSSKANDDRGHPSGYAWYFDFPHGTRNWDPFGYHGNKRALCVRVSGE
jgi:hypothetical protein